MRFCTIAELKAHAPEIVRETESRGSQCLITRHGKPMALIVPISEEEIEWTRIPSVRRRLVQALKERKEGKVVKG